MSVFSFNPSWMTALVLALHLLAGIGLGLLYFHALRRNVGLLVGGGRVVLSLALTAGRFGLVAVLFVLAAREGALPLLTLASGFEIARRLVLRRAREAVA